MTTTETAHVAALPRVAARAATTAAAQVKDLAQETARGKSSELQSFVGRFIF